MRLMTQKPSPHCPYPRSQLGITLIELMIALVIGLLATGAMLKVYVDSSQLYRFNEGLARIQENGRFGLEFIRRDVRMAGFWECYRDADLTNQISPGSANYIDFDAGHITGTNGLEHNGPDEPDEPDSITFLGAGRNVGTLSSDMTAPNSALNVSSTDDFAIEEAVLISDCETADIFRVTAVDHPAHEITTDELSKAYAAGSRLYRVQQTTFCIAEDADPAQPSLRQLVNPTSGQTCGKEHGDDLVEGIENMQILMGEDTDADSDGTGGDGTANRYVRPETSGLNVDRIVRVRISLLTISPANNVTTAPVPYFLNEREITPNDKYLRKVFTTTITLRNKTALSLSPAKGTSWSELSAKERDTVNVCWVGGVLGKENDGTGEWVVGNNSLGGSSAVDPTFDEQKDQREAVDCMLDWDGDPPRGCEGKYRNWDGNRGCISSGCEDQKCVGF